jgi:glucosamine kinase
VRNSAAAVDRMLERVAELGAGRIALMGGMAAPTRPYLDARAARLIVQPQGDALDGARLLAQPSAAERHDET